MGERTAPPRNRGSIHGSEWGPRSLPSQNLEQFGRFEVSWQGIFLRYAWVGLCLLQSSVQSRAPITGVSSLRCQSQDACRKSSSRLQPFAPNEMASDEVEPGEKMHPLAGLKFRAAGTPSQQKCSFYRTCGDELTWLGRPRSREEYSKRETLQAHLSREKAFVVITRNK